MSKNILRKNLLKDLIYIQENKTCNEKTIKGLFRAVLEPVLDVNEECLVMFKLSDGGNSSSLIKRLGFTKAIVKNYSNIEAFEGTEFVYVLSHRYGAVLVWDETTSDIEGQVGYYLLYNSKDLMETFQIIDGAVEENLAEFADKWHPDRRDNALMNSSVRKIVSMSFDDDELIDEIDDDEEDEKDDLQKRLDFLDAKSRFVAHEIRNQLSICDLYAEILKKMNLKNENVQNAINCIKKSISIASNTLLDLKSINNISLKSHNLKYVLETAISLSDVYAMEKNIVIKLECSDKINVLADEDKFLAVVVNLIKNGIEAIIDKGEIVVSAVSSDGIVTIKVENNGEMISQEQQAKIFESGFTTKSRGYGVGLYICKKSMEDMYGDLNLLKSDEISTIFEITIGEA